MSLSALVLAGAREDACPVALGEGTPHKSLALVGGQPILARVLAALRAGGIDRIVVMADQPDVIALATALGAEVMAPAPGPSASVAAAFAALGPRMLVTTSDHALLRARWVRDFLADTPAGADVSVLLAQRDLVEAAAPASRRTWLRFADGDWSGCNLFLLSSARAGAAIDTWRMVEADRKRPWRIAARLGLSTLAAHVLGRLSLDEAVGRLGRRIGLCAAAVAARDGLAALDVDKPSDLAEVRRIVATCSASGCGSA